nr:MAG TPA: hypothetical protein [Caudoviricetes sp.]
MFVYRSRQTVALPAKERQCETSLFALSYLAVSDID